MPRINLTITKAWRHGTDDRIHYTVERHDSEKTRHLYVDPGKGLYAHLEAALDAKGYRYPKSAEEVAEAAAVDGQ
jgi:hypothetical protein